MRWKKFKRQITFANSVIFLGLIILLIYLFSWLFPITDNAFVVNNIRPVSALTQGYITKLYVKNGDYVKNGQKLFSVFDKLYLYKVKQLESDLAVATSTLNTLGKTLEKDQAIIQTKQNIYIKLKQDDEKYQKAYQIDAISLMTLQNSRQATKAALDEVIASQKQYEIDKQKIVTQRALIGSVNSQLSLAKVNLNLTTVYAQTNGIVQNMFLSIGTPVNINQALFSFVDTQNIYFQANFNETDLRKVRKGSKVLIFPRVYLGEKIFHGIVMSDYWSANRQIKDPNTQLQNVINENQWILLPQRMPVQIKVLDPDPNYPLNVGTSAYVYIQT